MAGIMDSLSGDALRNGGYMLTASAAKAKIMIDDRREATEEDVKVLEAVQAAASSAKKGGFGGAIGGLQKLASKVDVKGVAEKTIKMGKNQMVDIADSAATAKLRYDKVFEVQFNPTSLTLDGYSGGQAHIQSATKSKSGVDYAPIATTMSFGVKLIFDKTDVGEAFPMDNFTVSTTAAVNATLKGVGKLWDKFRGGEGPSVQTIVEGFIACVRDPNTRRIAFEWGEMFYEGILNSVNTNYTMFNALGQPVRAEVSLRLILRDPKVSMKANDIRLGYWDSAYKRAFMRSHLPGNLDGDGNLINTNVQDSMSLSSSNFGRLLRNG